MSKAHAEALTVATLIAELAKLPGGDLPVVVRDNEGWAETVYSAWLAPNGGSSKELPESCWFDGPCVVIG